MCGSKSICLANNCNHSVDSDGEIDGQTTDGYFIFSYNLNILFRINL